MVSPCSLSHGPRPPTVVVPLVVGPTQAAFSVRSVGPNEGAGGWVQGRDPWISSHDIFKKTNIISVLGLPFLGPPILPSYPHTGEVRLLNPRPGSTNLTFYVAVIDPPHSYTTSTLTPRHRLEGGPRWRDDKAEVPSVLGLGLALIPM